MCTNSSEDVPNNKEAKNIRGSREYFPQFIASQCTEQQIQSRPVNKERRKMSYSLGKKKKHTVKNQLMVNKHRGYIIHKVNHKKGKRHDYDVYKNNHLLLPQNKLLM